MAEHIVESDDAVRDLLGAADEERSAGAGLVGVEGFQAGVGARCPAEVIEPGVEVVFPVAACGRPFTVNVTDASDSYFRAFGGAPRACGKLPGTAPPAGRIRRDHCRCRKT